MFTVLWMTAGARATPVDCDATESAGAFEQELDRAEDAVESLDPDDLGDAVRAARSVLRCVDAPVDRGDLGRLYLLDGIARFVDDDWVGAVTAFGVARALEPAASLPEPLGLPIRRVFAAVPPSSGDTVPLPAPIDGWLSVDGLPSAVAPTDRGYVVQWMRDDGTVHGTWLVERGDVPHYPAAVPRERRRAR